MTFVLVLIVTHTPMYKGTGVTMTNIPGYASEELCTKDGQVWTDKVQNSGIGHSWQCIPGPAHGQS